MSAAALKAHQLATEPVLGSGLLDSRWFLMGVVALEACLAFWIFLGVCARASWAVTLATFALFACVSAYNGLAGEESCGCFGRVKTSPWATFVLDLAVVVSLLSLPGCSIADDAGTRRLPTLAATLALAGLLASPALLSRLWTTETSEEQGTVVLNPDQWVGHKFPFFAELEDSTGLHSGRWHVVFYSSRCRICRGLVD